MDNIKEVFFNEYCKSCKYELKGENEEPCDSCLSEGGRENSHKPEKWEAK